MKLFSLELLDKMANIKEEIISEIKNLDVFKYLYKKAKKFDRNIYEKIVEDELQHHIKGHQYSSIFKNQLIDLYGNGFVIIDGYNHPYDSRDIYSTMDDVIDMPDSELRKTFLHGENIYYANHNRTFYSATNCIRYFEENYLTDKDVHARLGKLRKSFPNNKNLSILFANEIFLKSLSWEKKNGELLIYQKNSGNIKFLCMHIQGAEGQDNKKLFPLIKE